MSKLTKLLMLPLVCGLLVWLSACSNDNTEAASSLSGNNKISIASSIPENSSMVFHINIGQLMEKADYATIKQTSFFKDWVEDAKKDNPALVPFLEDPASTGINISADIAMAVTLAKSKEKKRIELSLFLS